LAVNRIGRRESQYDYYNRTQTESHCLVLLGKDDSNSIKSFDIKRQRDSAWWCPNL
jgi:hypothetical protein